MTLETVIHFVQKACSGKTYLKYAEAEELEKQLYQHIPSSAQYQLANIHISHSYSTKRPVDYIEITWKSTEQREDEVKNRLAEFLRYARMKQWECTASSHYLLNWNIPWTPEQFQQLKELSWPMIRGTSVKAEATTYSPQPLLDWNKVFHALEARGINEGTKLSARGKYIKALTEAVELLQPQWAEITLPLHLMKKITATGQASKRLRDGIEAGKAVFPCFYKTRARLLYTIPKQEIDGQQWIFPLRESHFNERCYEVQKHFLIPTEDIALYENVLDMPLLVEQAGDDLPSINHFLKTYDPIQREREQLKDLQRLAREWERLELPGVSYGEPTIDSTMAREFLRKDFATLYQEISGMDLQHLWEMWTRHNSLPSREDVEKQLYAAQWKESPHALVGYLKNYGYTLLTAPAEYNNENSHPLSQGAFHVLEFLKQQYTQRQQEFVRIYQKQYINEKPDFSICSWQTLVPLDENYLPALAVPEPSRIQRWSVQYRGELVDDVHIAYLSMSVEKGTEVEMRIDFRDPKILLEFQNKVCGELGITARTRGQA